MCWLSAGFIQAVYVAAIEPTVSKHWSQKGKITHGTSHFLHQLTDSWQKVYHILYTSCPTSASTVKKWKIYFEDSFAACMPLPTAVSTYTTTTTTTLHLFNGLFSRTTWVSRHQIGKPFWILLKQEMTEWQWHQLSHMQIIYTSLQTNNHASTSPLSFYTLDALPAAQPTASRHWR